MSRNTLALDIATITGWACSDGTSGTLDLSSYKMDFGELAATYEGWLVQMFDEHEVGRLVIERPFYRGAGDRVYFLNGMAFLTQAIAWRHKIERREVTASQVRKALLGKGRATKGEVMRWARQQGFEVADDNEADAIACLTYDLQCEAA